MSKKIASSDKINDTTLHELLLMMDARLKHIEDIEADNRALIVKMIKQGNSIVKFLSQIDIEPVDNPFEDTIDEYGTRWSPVVRDYTTDW